MLLAARARGQLLGEAMPGKRAVAKRPKERANSSDHRQIEAVAQAGARKGLLCKQMHLRTEIKQLSTDGPES